MKTIAMGLSLAALALAGVAYSAHAMPAGPGSDHTVTRADAMTRAGQMFDRMDANKDGKLDPADREAHRAAAFDRIDANKDGQISRAEFSAMEPGMGGHDGDDGRGMGHHGMGGRHMGGHGMGGGMMMQMADSNRDGAVTKAEMTAAAATRFDSADSNRDGSLSPEERQAARGAMHERMRSMAPSGEAPAAPPASN